jgi:hypothetical protein
MKIKYGFKRSKSNERKFIPLRLSESGTWEQFEKPCTSKISVKRLILEKFGEDQNQRLNELIAEHANPGTTIAALSVKQVRIICSRLLILDGDYRYLSMRGIKSIYR